jgi:hypothetical protein
MLESIAAVQHEKYPAAEDLGPSQQRVAQDKRLHAAFRADHACAAFRADRAFRLWCGSSRLDKKGKHGSYTVSGFCEKVDAGRSGHSITRAITQAKPQPPDELAT